MDTKDIDKMAFVTKQGLLLFTIMTYDLCNAPATYEHPMELVLSGLNWKIKLNLLG